MRFLLIFFGLMRTYEITYPLVSTTLDLDGIEARGGRVDILITTSLHTRCSPKDVDFLVHPRLVGCFNSKGYLQKCANRAETCRRAMVPVSDAEHEANIRRLYGARLTALIDSDDANITFAHYGDNSRGQQHGPPAQRPPRPLRPRAPPPLSGHLTPYQRALPPYSGTQMGTVETKLPRKVPERTSTRRTLTSFPQALFK